MINKERPYKRTDRIADSIKSILGEIFLNKLFLDHNGIITITNVTISKDLRYSKIFVTFLSSEGKTIDIINELNDYYLDKYGDQYDMYVQEDDKALSYFYYFYPPDYNIISFKDPKSSELKKSVTTLWLTATQEKFDEYRTLEALLYHYQDGEDDKFPEELDNTKEKTFLKVAGIR